MCKRLQKWARDLNQSEFQWDFNGGAFLRCVAGKGPKAQDYIDAVEDTTITFGSDIKTVSGKHFYPLIAEDDTFILTKFIGRRHLEKCWHGYLSERTLSDVLPG